MSKQTFDACLVQDACNPIAVLNSFKTMVTNGLTAEDPVAVMFACKIGSLSFRAANMTTGKEPDTLLDLIPLMEEVIGEMRGKDGDTARSLPSFGALGAKLEHLTKWSEGARVADCFEACFKATDWTGYESIRDGLKERYQLNV